MSLCVAMSLSSEMDSYPADILRGLFYFLQAENLLIGVCCPSAAQEQDSSMIMESGKCILCVCKLMGNCFLEVVQDDTILPETEILFGGP